MNLKTPVALLTHSLPCIGGLLKRCDPTLIKARTQLLFKGKFTPFVTRKGYRIENTQQLYCYWDLDWEAIVFRGGWTKKLPEKPVILDIGANYGTFGFLCKKRWPKATIIGFEPIPDLAKYCEKLGCYDRVHAVALSDSTGTATLFLDYSLGVTATLGGNELLKFTDSKIQVETKKLDDFDLHPDFIKVDVDGGELIAIAGGSRTFRDCPLSVIECRGEERYTAVRELLQKKSKRLYIKGADFLFFD